MVTVGRHLNVSHLAAAPLGMAVTFHAEVTGVNDRRIQFRVAAFEEKEKIGEGTHERAIINVARFATRLAEKTTEPRQLGSGWSRLHTHAARRGRY
jgi:predicted thioesterase